MKKILENQYVVSAIYALMALMVVIPIIGSLLKSGIDCDATYYICEGERITEGYVPYVDMALGYSPLWFYIEAEYKILFHIPNGVYWPYLILFYIFQIVGAYFLYRLIRSLDIKKTYAIFAAWLYVFMSHWLQGNAMLLEVPTMTFGTLACWLVVEFKDRNFWHYIWIGCVAACSFMVKQYGLGTFVLCLYLMLFVSKSNWKPVFAFVVGYSLPFMLCLGIWGNSFIHSVFLNGYGTMNAAEAGYDVSLGSKVMNVFDELNYFCYMICPIVYFGWLFAVRAYRQGRLPQLIFAYCGIFGYSLSFYFTGGQLHYFQNLLPFAILLIVELLHITKGTKWRYELYVLIAWVMLVSTYKTFYNRVYKQYIKGNERTEQIQLARSVSEYVKDGETMFIIHGGLYYLYFTADILPPNIGSIGYSFGPMGLNERAAMQQIDEADWVIRFSADYDFESFFTDSLKHHLEQYPAICICDSAILLHKMQ